MSQQKTMNLRNNLIWIAILVLVLLLYFAYANKSAIQTSEINPATTDGLIPEQKVPTTATTNQSTQPAMQDSTDKNLANNVSDATIEWIPGDQAQKEQYLRWKAGRGWHDMLSEDTNGASDYRNYSREVLEKLGEQGDLRALHSLARLPISPAESKNALTKAATHGSTFALVLLANEVTTEAGFRANPTEEGRRQVIMEALAYAEVVRIRGEATSAEGKISTLKQVYEFSPTETESRLIQQRAKEIYNDLSDRRRELGLTEFDNTIPPVAKAFEKFMHQN